MITFKNFLAEKALNSKVYASTIERLGSEAKMGFELEMWVPEESDLLIIDDGDSSKGHFGKTAEEAKKSLEDVLGVDVVVNGKDIDNWRIVSDGSIQEEGIGTGIEVVSPPTPVEDALGDLKQCFKWMSAHDVVTNSTTGLHLNLSIPDLYNNLDSLKLILFMGEAHVLKSYERDANSYAKKHYGDLIASIQETGVIPKSAWKLHSIATAALKNEKYRTVNLSKLDQGYLEFRTAGNENYHKKYQQVASDVGRFLTVLEVACDPNAERNEYLKKLVKLFGEAKDKANAGYNMSMDPDAKGLEKIISPSNVFLLKKYGNSDSTVKQSEVVKLLSKIMIFFGNDLVKKDINVSEKTVAEFKVLLNRITKNIPDIMSQVRAAVTSQVELDNIKAFKKAFNLK